MVRYGRPLRPRTGWRLADGLAAGALRLAGPGTWVRSRHEAELVNGAGIDEELDDLYDRVAPRVGTSLVRDGTYVRWRFLQNPSRSDQMLVTRLGGRLTGYLVFAMREDGALIKDWLADDDAARDRLFAACQDEAYRRGARSVSVVALETHPDLSRLWKFGFLRRPDSYTAVTYAGASFPGRSAVTAADAWYMTAGDRDV
jgi:hypothetical protein